MVMFGSFMTGEDPAEWPLAAQYLFLLFANGVAFGVIGKKPYLVLVLIFVHS